MKIKKVLLVLLTVCITFNLSGPVKAEGNLSASYLHSCVETPNLPCIKSVTIFKDDKEYVGKRTGRAATGIILYNQSVPLEQFGDEYSFLGLSFEGTSQNSIVTRVMYFPPGQQLCWPQNGTCSVHKDILEISAEPSWLSSPGSEREIEFSRGQTKLMCGTLQVPTGCSRPLNFNQNLQINYLIQTPSDFQPIFAQARASAFTFQNSKEPSNSYSLTSVSLTPRMMSNAIFSPLQPNPIKTNPYADFESDQLIAWIYGRGDDWTLSLGQCASVKMMTVSSNALNIGSPTWNPSTRSIEIQLDAQHFTSKGSIIAGYFQAVISKELGQCLWGVDLSQNVKAQISLNYGVGSATDIQTLTGNYSNGSYILTANNFHYSSPLLSLRVQNFQTTPDTLVASPSPSTDAGIGVVNPTTVKTPSPRPTGGIKPAKEKTLLCVKGKIHLNVPISRKYCPKGYMHINK